LHQDPYEALSLATRMECAKPIDVGLVNNRVGAMSWTAVRHSGVAARPPAGLGMPTRWLIQHGSFSMAHPAWLIQAPPLIEILDLEHGGWQQGT